MNESIQGRVCGNLCQVDYNASGFKNSELVFIALDTKIRTPTFI